MWNLYVCAVVCFAIQGGSAKAHRTPGYPKQAMPVPPTAKGIKSMCCALLSMPVVIRALMRRYALYRLVHFTLVPKQHVTPQCSCLVCSSKYGWYVGW